MGTYAVEGEVLPAGEFDPDVERAFGDFRESLEEADGGGTINVHKIPMDEQGNPMGNSKAYSRLFTCPIGSQSLDDVCARIKREYMRRDELRICVRIMASRAGERGIRFNRIIILERPNETETKPAGGMGGDLASVMDAMTRMNAASQARSEAMFQRMMDMQMQARALPPAPAFDPMAMMQGVIGMMAVTQKMFVNPVGAVVAADPIDQLTKTLTLLPRLSSLMGNGRAPDEDEGMGSLVKALAPAAAELIKLAGNRQQQPVAQPQIQRAQAVRAKRPEPAGPVGPAAEVAAEVAATVAQATSLADPPAPASAGENDVQNLDAIKAMVTGLIEIASQDTGCDKCEEAAAEILAQVPDEMDDTVFELVSSPTTYKMKLMFVDLRTGAYAAWFEKFRVAVFNAYDIPGTQASDDADERTI